MSAARGTDTSETDHPKSSTAATTAATPAAEHPKSSTAAAAVAAKPAAEHTEIARTGTPSGNEHADVAILKSGQFIIRTYQFKLDKQDERSNAKDDDDADEPDSREGYRVETGSILSQTLKKTVLKGPNQDVTTMTLALLRKITPGMSAFSRIHRFCTRTGTIIRDESISIVEYLSIEASSSQSDEQSTESTGGRESGTSERPVVKATSSSHGTKSISIYFKSPSYVTASYGQPPDPSESTEPEQNEEQNDGENDETGAQSSPTPYTKAKVRRVNYTSLIPADEGPTATADLKTASALSEQEWGTVLRNCAVFYGWVINPETGRVSRATRPAFRLRSKLAQDPVSKIPDFVPVPAVAKATDLPSPKTVDPRDSTSLADWITSSTDKSEAEPPATQPGSVTSVSLENSDPDSQNDESVQFEEKLDKGIPNFRTNDDSKIEITACKHELMLAMATNDFSSESTEATASGGYAGITVSATASHSESRELNTSKTFNSMQQVLVARYLFPRCDLIFSADDLEPSPELANLLDLVKKTKNIQALRKIHRLYGTHYCQNLTLGARLMTTKVFSSTSSTSEMDAKQSLRTSVGVSVSTPYGGGGVKHEEESRKGVSKASEESAQRESQVFEACGGDTLLANNPNAWASTVGRSDLWRVINRDGLMPMADLLSEMPGYSAVRSWFIQAVPALRKYITLEADRSTVVRLRVTAPTNSLSVNNDGRAGFYLGHGVGSQVTPRMNGVAINKSDTIGILNFWMRLDYVVDKFLFQPETYRAPVIQGFPNFDVGGGRFGQTYNPAFAETVWRMSCPFGEELVNGSRVIMQTCPYVSPVTVSGTSQPAPVSHMTVFRNTQGIFLPGMSDHDEVQYWRILKVDGSAPGSHIQSNDEVRLCWAFDDQLTGFRDFKDDCFGRHRNQCPPELQGKVLYLKLPWPRFERVNVPNAMLMSPDGDSDLKGMYISTAQTASPMLYIVQDVKFRIDSVSNGVYGDTDDYLLKGVQQKGDLQNLVGVSIGFRDSSKKGGFVSNVKIAATTFGLPSA